jgi:D-alanyl-lipoteichoic acid acyltransferase DltB (MBOAT superfamily)
MLLGVLIAFTLVGLLSRYLGELRLPVILLLSAGTIAFLSPISLLFCVFTATINFALLQGDRGKTIFFFSVFFNVIFLVGFHAYMLLHNKYSSVVLPELLGVSFLSLQYIDYHFRVHYRVSKSPAHVLPYLSAVLYLPKFFSGPVVTLPLIEEQIIKPGAIKIYTGLNRIVIGLFKKLVLAESLAVSVHSVFDFQDAYPGLTVLCAGFLFSLQLYFDFSGYSDIAVGASLVWGIELPENFIFPFRQKSWSDFWKSWHASLTQWLWQYVFNPLFLHFERRGTNRKMIYLFCSVCVFAAMAFFNGIKSGFYVSAGIFALLYATEQWFNIQKQAWRSMTIFVLFSFALIFFRNPDASVYTSLAQQIFSADFLPQQWLKDFWAPLASGGAQQDYFNFSFTILLCLTFLFFERKIFSLFSSEKINYLAWFVLLILILMWGVFDSGERFIYMQTAN